MTEYFSLNSSVPLAYDRIGSVRSLDEDGRLKVHITHISKACINPYKGSEIPDWEGLGLKPDKIYYLLRSPKALAEGAKSFNSLPLLLEHVHVSAQTPHHHMIVGSTGSEARFKAPYLDNSLSIWDQKAIDRILNGEQRELSCAYRYDPVMKPGFYEEKPYDGVMTNLRGNHVALVRKGRAGSDVLVADASPLIEGQHFISLPSGEKLIFSSGIMPFVKAVEPFCPNVPQRKILAAVSRLIAELNRKPANRTEIAQDHNPNHFPKGSEKAGQFAPKEGGLPSPAEQTPSHSNHATALNQLEHFIEENFETDSTDFLDLRQTLDQKLSPLLTSRDKKTAALKTDLSIVQELMPPLVKHLQKKGWRFTTRQSLQFPLKNNLAPWMEKEGKWIGKAGSSTAIRLMPPSEDPYQSALNFVRSIRKYQHQQGIKSVEQSRKSYKQKEALLIKFDDGSTIFIRKAGDSSHLTPDNQVTITANGSSWGKNRKFKFPNIKGDIP